MPLYDFQCCSCQREFEGFAKIADRNDVKCECGGETRRVFLTPPMLSMFRPGWWRDIAKDPIHCSTPQELKDACEKHGARSPYLEEGVWSVNEGESHRFEDRGGSKDYVLHRQDQCD